MDGVFDEGVWYEVVSTSGVDYVVLFVREFVCFGYSFIVVEELCYAVRVAW